MKIHSRNAARLAVSAIILGLAGSANDTWGATQTVLIQGFKFVPANLTNNVGDTVTWEQKDTIQHTSTSDASPPTWDSGLLAVSQTYSFKFSTAGTFPYHCTPHSTTMHGSVTVQAAVANNPPVVSLTNPGKGAIYLLPANITLQATASETNGTIARVEFWSGTNSLGIVTQSPYSLTWSNVPAGLYQLTAKAVDANNSNAVSAPVTVAVTDTAAYAQHNLVSDIAGLADHTDTHLLNPWAIATSATSPFWISDNHSGLSTLYDTDGNLQTPVVTIPPAAGGAPPAAPTGMVFNNTPDFVAVSNQPARFIFASEDGTITAWNSGSNALLKADNSVAGAIYKGLALGNSGGTNYLYAADFHHGKVDVFGPSFQKVTWAGAFVDPTIPAGFAAFGIQLVGGNLYVTYAKQDDNQEDDVSGPGNGYVDVFDTSGHLLKRFASNGTLNSPWGIAVAPAGFGPFSGALLIGNFGDGRINAFDPTSGALQGQISDGTGNPLSNEGLWGLKFGNGGRGGDANRLYFTAGISGGGSREDHGLFGSISAETVVRIMSVADQAGEVSTSWAGGVGPFLVQFKGRLSDANWVDLLTTSNRNTKVPAVTAAGFFRVLDQAPAVVTPFTVRLSATNELSATGSSGTGAGVLSLSGTNLTYWISYSGLTGVAQASHIHGPASTTQNAGVLFPLSGELGTAGVLSGTQGLTSQQMNEIISGNTYVNIHTPANPGGEIRGQVVPMH